jgi:hypothetical protein
MNSNDTIKHGFNTSKSKSTFNFSRFKNAKATIKEKDIDVLQYLIDVSDPAREDEAKKLRALPIDEYKKVKPLQPCITGSCVMDENGRSLKDILYLNGLAVIDFDNLPGGYSDWLDFKKDLESDPFTFIVHFSLSGRGLCVFVKIPKENNFKEVYLSFAEYYDMIFGAKLDYLADETRLRFLAYDPNPFYNPNSQVYADILKQEQTAEPIQQDNDSVLDSFSNDPAVNFNNSGLEGLEIINGIFENLGYTTTAGKKPTIFEYQRAGGSLKSIVAFYNSDVVKFQVFSPNTGLKKEHYNLYELYTELKNLDHYAAQKELAGLGFGNFTESTKNPFPIEVLPQLFRELAKDLNETVNFPIDYTATAMFTAAATAAGTNIKALVKSGWTEYGSLFACVIGNAGAMKTHPINTVFAPIKAIDKTRHESFKVEYELYSSYDKLSKKDKETIEGVIIPILEKSVLSNFTTEILFKRLSENPRGCSVLSDEMISFFEGMNNYSKSDQIGLYLSIWSNQPTTIDRISNPVPLFLSNPYLSIIGGLQPRALNKAFPIDKLNNGFFQRFLFAYPDSSLKAPINDNVANEQLAKDYESFINKLFEIDESRTLTFSPAAKRYFYDWQANNCHRVNEHQNSIKGEILSKFDNHFIRLALLVQIMNDPESKEITIEAVEASKALCEYYLNCSFKVLAKIQNTENYLQSLPKDKQQLFNELDQSFTKGEATEIGLDLGLSESTIKRFLQDTQLFKKAKHGNYLKTISS